MIEEVGTTTPVPGHDLRRQVAELRRIRPDLYARIDPDRVRACLGAPDAPGAPGAARDDFAGETDGGRGPSYIRAQSLNVEARRHGIETLLGLVRRPGARRTVVDLLGGDGLLSRVCRILGLADTDIITCDASPHMVEAAWATGVPALLQRAERLLFRPESVDAVLLAYGSHHIDPADRLGVAREAHRALRPGGVFLLHDFLTGSPAERWFSEVVDPHSLTGHRYAHFTRAEIRAHLTGAGFDRVEVKEIDDPYTATGSTAAEAELRLGEYLIDMYGLHKAGTSPDPAERFSWAARQAKSIFRYADGDGAPLESVTEYIEHLNAWRLVVPRRAVVGIGEKDPGHDRAMPG